MTNWLLRRAIPVGIAILASCDGGVVSGPRAPRTVIAGDYQLVAAGENVSRAWDTYNVRVEGIVRLEQDPVSLSKLSCTFRDLRVEEGDGVWMSHQMVDGAVTGSIDASGRLILELRAPSAQFTWSARGLVVDSHISGEWTSSHPAAGSFTAELVH